MKSIYQSLTTHGTGRGSRPAHDTSATGRGRCPGSPLYLILLTTILLCMTGSYALAGGDSCTYDPVTSGNFGTTSTPPVPDYSNLVYIWADLHDYTHTCWSEYCHGTPKLRNYLDPTESTACHNACENCCLYHFNVQNLRQGVKIHRIDLCTDRGCKPTPIPPMQPCITNPPTYTGGVDHICEYCPAASMLFRGSLGQTPAFWNEVSECPRIFNPTGGTLADGYQDSLCRSNCLRIAATSSGNAISYLDTLQITLGLTGDCLGRSRPTGTGADWWGKCIWVCVTWSDGIQACHQIRVKHCTCTDLPSPQCDRCTQDSCVNSVGPGATSPPPKLSLSRKKKNIKKEQGGTMVSTNRATTNGTQLKRRK